MTFLQVGMGFLGLIVVAWLGIAIWLSGHAGETKDDWQQEDDL